MFYIVYDDWNWMRWHVEVDAYEVGKTIEVLLNVLGFSLVEVIPAVAQESTVDEMYDALYLWS
jgi:hypothetical protein